MEKLVEFITFTIRLLIGWIPMLLIFCAPMMPLIFIIVLIRGYNDMLSTMMGLACAYALYNSFSPYKRLVDYTTNVSGKIMDWIGG